jgi:hypothetical protein
MKSGKEFRPVNLVAFSPESWLYYSYETSVRFSGSDALFQIDEEVLTARYELKPELKKVEVTAEQVTQAIRSHFTGSSDLINRALRELGLD